MKKRMKKKMSFNEFENEEKGIVWTAIDFASNIPVSIYSESVGIKAPEASYRSAVISENTRLTGEEYLLNAKHSSIDMSLAIGVFNYSYDIRIKTAISNRDLAENEIIENDKIIDLPKYKIIKDSFSSVIRSRRSVRKMSGRKITLEELSTLLFHGDGVTGKFTFNSEGALPPTETLGGDYESTLRTAPSGGGLYPISLYCVVINVEGMERGIYRYLPIHHQLQVISIFNEQEYEDYLKLANYGINIDSSKLGVSIYYIYNLYDNSRKYGDMAMQFAYIEAGEIAENIQLTCTALDLAVTDVGGYEKALTEQFLGLDGLTKHMIHLTLIGNK
jgi:SagB-type dehydrogenase family enzyme